MIAALLLLLQGDAVVLKGGVLHVGDGRLLTGATILIRGGVVEAVGEQIEAPEGAVVVVLPASAHVVPGFIDLHTHLGMAAEQDEPAGPITPHMRAADGYSTDRDDVRAARGSGVTTVALAPGEANLVGGAMSVVRLGDGYLHEALVEPVAAMKLSLGAGALLQGREPTSPAGALALLERELADAGSETHRRLVKEKKPAFVHATTVEAISRALELRTRFGIRLVLLHADAADDAVDAIAAAGVPVVLGPLTMSDDDRTLRRAGLLAGKGVRIGFASDAPVGTEEQLRHSAILAVRHGLGKDAALQAMTSGAAKILGLDALLGTIEAGRAADLVVYDGHPLAPTSRVERVIAGGRTVFERSPK